MKVGFQDLIFCLLTMKQISWASSSSIDVSRWCSSHTWGNDRNVGRIKAESISYMFSLQPHTHQTPTFMLCKLHSSARLESGQLFQLPGTERGRQNFGGLFVAVVVVFGFTRQGLCAVLTILELVM